MVNKDELEFIMGVLEQAKRDAETVHSEFRGRKDPVEADTTDISKAIEIVQRELSLMSNVQLTTYNSKGRPTGFAITFTPNIYAKG